MQVLEREAGEIEAMLGPRLDVTVAAVHPGDTLARWGEIFSTVLVRKTGIQPRRLVFAYILPLPLLPHPFSPSSSSPPHCTPVLLL